MTTTTYKVKGLYGKFTPCEFILDSEGLERWTNTKGFTLESVEEITVSINYPTAEGCKRCTTDAYVPHYNCRCGANRSHCTSDYCY